MEKIQPKVAKMDEEAKMDENVIKGMFEQGLMGIEIESDYGGSNLSFMSSVLVVEELAKVDPSVSVLCDVQNTLVVPLIRKYASEDIKKNIFLNYQAQL